MKTLFLKKRIALASLLLTAAFVVLTVWLNLDKPVLAASEEPFKKTLSVSGQARVNATPDIATISLGVITEDSDAKMAQKNNAAAMDKVIASVKAAGVAEEDIKTVNFSISPKYDYANKTGVKEIVGYTVRNTVEVTVRDISKVGNIIDAAADSGANVSNSISFSISNYEDYYNKALKNAVLAAKKKAETIASAMGLTLKAPISISEGGGYSPLRNYVTFSEAEVADSASTPIQAGTIEITATVNVVYEY